MRILGTLYQGRGQREEVETRIGAGSLGNTECYVGRDIPQGVQTFCRGGGARGRERCWGGRGEKKRKTDFIFRSSKGGKVEGYQLFIIFGGLEGRE